MNAEAISLLRWMAVLPVSILATWWTHGMLMLLGRFALSYANVEPDGFLSNLYDSTVVYAAMGAAFVHSGAYTSPSNRNAVGFMMAAISIAVAGFLAASTPTSNAWWPLVAPAFFLVGAAGLAWSIHSGNIDFDQRQDGA